MLDVISSFSYYVGVNTMAIQSMKESSERKMVDARNLKENKNHQLEVSVKFLYLEHGPWDHLEASIFDIFCKSNPIWKFKIWYLSEAAEGAKYWGC